jgi:hypothetical protein
MNDQAANGTPHFTYYDELSALSFVWDGQSNQIDVSQGGYQEPVVESFNVPMMVLDENETAVHWLLWFQAACLTYATLRGRE